MSFVAIALSSALMLTTPLLVAERSELLADHATAEPVVSPAAAVTSSLLPRRIASSPAPVASPSSSDPESPSSVIVGKDDDQDVSLSKRTDSAVSVSSMAPLSVSVSSDSPSSDSHLTKSPRPQSDDADDEALAMSDEQCDDLLTSPDAPLSFKAARQLLFPEPSLVALPFPTTLMDFAMDGPAVKHALPVVEEGELEEEGAISSQEKEEWVVQSHAGGMSAQPCHVGIGFPFGI